MDSPAAENIRPASVRFTPTPPAWRSVDRALTLLVFIGTTGVLLVAAWLTPSTKGIGTHTALGLPPCGWETATGYPCVSCGMTTAFAHAADGNLWTSFQTQPAGMLLALLAAMVALTTGYSLVMRVSIGRLVERLVTPWSFGFAVAVLMLAWGYKALLVREVLPPL